MQTGKTEALKLLADGAGHTFEQGQAPTCARSRQLPFFDMPQNTGTGLSTMPLNRSPRIADG
jgi:hypothetical protein